MDEREPKIKHRIYVEKKIGNKLYKQEKIPYQLLVFITVLKTPKFQID